ncbi:ATP-grasp domain-containing protein [Methyloglobulus sp.]|uniref:ATP-grasp domain-containing protein n=1 Tax=Methyloglobulus sp. TaxID=2518622 RepID=UPI0032B7C84C
MKKLKILIFEYITGGGLNKSDLPESLAREGLLMLQSLLDNLVGIEMVECLIMLDFRMVGRLATNPYDIHIIRPEHECRQELTRLMSLCDAVWPIAPESDFILQTLCEEVERSGKLLLTSPASVVAIAGNKWLTYQHLRQHSINTVPTQRLSDFCFTPSEWIVKPVDGVGCEDSYLVSDQEDFDTVTSLLDKNNYIVQPHIQGAKISLSCLFKKGRGWLLCANRQQFDIINKQYHLTGITVNFTSDISMYQDLVNDVAKAMTDLWGYAGIDLIVTPDQILVLEINPRLTTSYAGLYAALGMNCADAVLDLLSGDPHLEPTHHQAVNIETTKQESYAS